MLDDLDKSAKDWAARFLKIWSDRYPFIGEIKGGTVTPTHKLFYVTSQYSIDEIWEDTPTQEALHRRFRVIHMEDPFANGNGPLPGHELDTYGQEE